MYYSREHGLAETRYVFLKQNRLPERFAKLKALESFTIAETGFGTGLNFLATWQLWRETPGTAGSRLHFVSVEKHPLNKPDLERALASWPELAELSAALISSYPELIAGQHRVEFDQGRVVLDLIFADAAAGLQNLLLSRHPDFVAHNANVDAWYLDGFAPGSNPGMWSEALFDCIAALSKVDSSFATFTAAGFVRRGLQARGFNVEKIGGYGRKREMLRGCFAGHDDLESTEPRPKRRIVENAAWHLPPLQARPHSVAVIGAGLAGCHTAAALAKRGLQVTVIEQHETVADAASGNPQAILYTKLSHQDGHLNRFALASFLHACRFYRQQANLPGEFCGVLQLLNSATEAQRIKLESAFANQESWCEFVDSQRASELAGLPIDHPCVYFPQAGWLRPRELCRQLLSDANITLRTGQRVTHLIYDQGWRLQCSDGSELNADAVVIANSHQAAELEQCAHLPLKRLRGQLTFLKADALRYLPEKVICHEGYLAPPVDDTMVIGASYDTKSTQPDIRGQDNTENLRKLSEALPSVAIETESGVTGARAAMRCTTPDYLPLVGPAPIHTQQLGIFAPLRKDAKGLIRAPAACYPGLYLNLAQGSRGLTSTPLAAELIAAQLCHEILPLPLDLVRALSPSRFLIRSLIRGR